MTDRWRGSKQTRKQRKLIVVRLINMHECFTISSETERSREVKKQGGENKKKEEEQQEATGH